MDWMNMIGGLAQQLTGGGAPPPGQMEQHYDQMAQSTTTSAIANGLAAAFRSDQTPAFAQMAAQLFGASNGSQQASLLNTLLATAGPALLSGALTSGKMPGLSSLLGGGGARELTPAEVAQVPAEEIQHLADHVEKHDPSIVDRVSEIYAQHPGVVKSLGGAALAIALAKIAQSTQR